MPPLRENAYNLVVCPPESNQIKNLKSAWRRVQNLRISLKMCKRVTLEGQIYGQNSKF